MLLTIQLLLCATCLRFTTAVTATLNQLEDVRFHFERFMEQHGKRYNSEIEKQVRFEIFKENVERVNYMNENSDHAVYGITKFMDMTQEEFLGSYTGLRASLDHHEFDDGCDLLTDKDILDVDTPESFDWRDYNAVTRVKDQKECQSCYAFSATGNIEAQYAIKYKKLIELSEQQIIDCGRMMMCYGGLPSISFRALINMSGAESEEDYPYLNDNGDCKFNKSKVRVKVKDCNRYNLTSQEKVKQLLYKNGPISIGVASHSLHSYVNGIISDECCGNYNVTHAVLLVGYGSENGKDYWTAKNSWGEEFGEKGYFRMQRGEGASSCKMMNDKMAMSVIL